MFCFNPFVLLLCVVKRPDKSPEAFVVSDVSWSELLPRDGAELRLLSCAMCIVGPMKSGGHMGGCYFCICDVSVGFFFPSIVEYLWAFHIVHADTQTWN